MEADKGENVVAISYSMLGLMNDVRSFHAVMGMPLLKRPKIVEERIQLRLDLITEEYKELNQAILDDDIVELSDAIVDSIYVLIGMGLEFGIPLHKVWKAVQESNMDKVDRKTGVVKKREDGKILKPEGWKPPDVKKIIEEELAKEEG